MKIINRISGILKAAGWTIILIALALTVYSISSNQSEWGNVNQALKNSGASTGLVDRLKFDDAYFSAMAEAQLSDVKATSLRNEAARAHFAYLAEEAAASVGEADQALAEERLNYLANEFDFAKYVADFERREGLADAQEAREIISYLDSLCQPAAKGGKKLPAIASASTQAGLEETYAALMEDYSEEEGGSWIEFLRTIRTMADSLAAEGTTLPKGDDFAKTVFDLDEYLEELEVTRSTEQGERAASFIDKFTEAAEKKAAGEEVDFAAFMDQEYQTLAETFPKEEISSRKGAFIDAAVTSLESGTSFDGSYASLLEAYKQKLAESPAAAMISYVDTFAAETVKTSDNSSKIPFVGQIWWLTGKKLWLFGLGILLLIIAFIFRRLMNMALLSRQKEEAVVEDPDVLLRVEHLKQYFRSGNYINKAVDDVSFFIKKGEVFGLVGESGCGKTTTGRTIINLYDPTDGKVIFHGLNVSSTQNGSKVLIRSMKNEAKNKIAELEREMKEAIKKDPSSEASAKQAFKEEKRRIKKDLSNEIAAKQLDALKSGAAKAKSADAFRKQSLARLKAEYEEDIKNLSGAELEERKQKYEIEKKAASKKNGMMTKMQMIFQDPIASIDPRMTVREIIAEGLKIRGIRDKRFIDEKVYEMLEMVGLVREHADRYPHEFSGGQRQRIGIARAIVMEPELIIADEPISALDVSIQAQVINLLNDLRNNMGLTILFIAHNLSVVKYFSDRIAVMYFGKIVEMADSDELFLHPLHPYTKSLLSAIPYPDPHYEKQRKRIEYNPATAHDYSVDKPTLREIIPGHFILCNDAEFQKYQEVFK